MASEVGTSPFVVIGLTGLEEGTCSSDDSIVVARADISSPYVAPTEHKIFSDPKYTRWFKGPQGDTYRITVAHHKYFTQGITGQKVLFPRFRYEDALGYIMVDSTKKSSYKVFKTAKETISSFDLKLSGDGHYDIVMCFHDSVDLTKLAGDVSLEQFLQDEHGLIPCS